MAQNTLSKLRGSLTIKYSPVMPIGDADADKLARSLEVAKRAIRAAVDVLDPITRVADLRQDTIPQLPYLVMRYHFHLPSLATKDTLAWKAWRYYVLRAANTLRAVELGLMDRVVIADTYGTIVGRDMQAAAQDAHDLIARQGAGLSVQQKNAMINQARLKAAAAADPVAMSMRGNVLLKKKVALSLTATQCAQWESKDPSLRMTPDQMSSIHLNFPDLLQNPAVTIVCVARTIIHEGSHKFCDTRDFAYADSPAYKQLTESQAAWNADSYAYMAVSLYKRHVFTTSLSMQQPPAGVDMNH